MMIYQFVRALFLYANLPIIKVEFEKNPGPNPHL